MLINPEQYCELIGLLVNNAVWIHGDQTSICTSQSMVTFVPRQNIGTCQRKNEIIYSPHISDDGYKHSQLDNDLTLYILFSSPVNLCKQFGPRSGPT